MIELRPYQASAIDDLRAGFRNSHVRQVLCAPTGAGKSVTALDMLRSAVEKGSKVGFFCERRVLVEQFSRHLDSIGIDHGVMMASHWRFRPQAPVQVASIQTLERMESLPWFDVVFIDEIHAAMRKSVIQLMESRPSLKIVGMTATPFHPAMGKHFSRITNVTTMAELVAEGFLVPFRVFVAHEIDTKGLKIVAGEWNKGELEQRGIQVVGDVVTDYLKLTNEVYGGPVKTICFSAGVAHGADLSRKFAESGVNAIQISYKDDEDYKAEVLTEFSKPDTEIQMVISSDILTRGFDQPDVRHVILARPLRKSFSTHVQMVGRGARIYDGKEFCTVQDHCIATGMRVLTHRGLVPIEKILKTDTIWDGHEFVQHKGVVNRGRRPIIRYAGLAATPDHLVKTDKGWRTFGACAEEQAPIVTTGIDRTAIRECENYFTTGCLAWTKATPFHACALRMRKLWVSINNLLYESDWWPHAWMPTLQPNSQTTTTISTLAVRESSKRKGAMHKQKTPELQGLRRARDKVQIRISDCIRTMDRDELAVLREMQGIGIGQDRQRWPLRTGKYQVGNSQPEYAKQAGDKMDSIDAQVQAGIPRSQICRPIAAGIYKFWNVIRRNRGTLQQTIEETEGQVWDILNCGPRNSFTCEGYLVHNSGNWLRFLKDWNTLYHEGVSSLMDADTKTRKEPTEREKDASKCPKCSAVWPAKSDTCLHCGFVRQRRNDVLNLPGEMKELGDAKPKYDSATKEKWYRELLGYAQVKGYQSGWAFHKYKEKFGVEPNWTKTAEPPGRDVLNWIKSRAIAYAKKRAA